MDRLSPEPDPECWLHPEVEIGPSSIAELGLFARAAIERGAIVSRLGGRLVTGKELRQIFTEAAQQPDHPYARSPPARTSTLSCRPVSLTTTATTAVIRTCGGPTRTLW
jgi:hypothetical protein